MKYFVYFITALVLALIIYHFNRPVVVTTNEIFPANEAEQIAQSVEHFKNIIDNNRTDYVARGAHSKAHACVKAYFRIREDISTELRHGVFSNPGQEYKSWIRFSNGASNVAKSHDANKDARGMAIKIINPVDSITQQDFLMHDSPVFFTANIEDYNRFTVSKNKILYFISDWNPFNWKLRELKHGLNTLKPPPSSPLLNQYFSNTAYKLGPHNIKFSAKSCADQNIPATEQQTAENFLRAQMVQELQHGAGCFHFMVQLQIAGKPMPIEDPSILWKENDSAFLPVADIEIPIQNFDSVEQNQFCEDLSFSPWHALEEHRPIGELNRIRKQVYQASSDFRHQENQTKVPTNLDW